MLRTMRRTAIVTFLLWLVIVCALAAARVRWAQSLPPDGETYAQTTSFQLFAFAIAELPWLVLLLGIVIGVEYLVLRRGPHGTQ